MSARINYEEVEKALTSATADTSAAEAHGMLCGMLAVAGRAEINDWMNSVMGEGDPRNVAVKQAQALLMDMHHQTKAQMTSGEFDLQLLLPSDDVSLDERIVDLTEWCQGFLYGMTVAGVKDVEALPGEVGEIVADIVDISKAGYDAGDEEDGEENEAAFMEIVEYLKVGALLVYAEFNKNEDGSNPTIH